MAKPSACASWGSPLWILRYLRSSRWRSHPLFIFSFFTDGMMFAFRICWHFIEFFQVFFLMTLLWRLYLCRCRCTVEQFTTTPESAKSSWRSFAVKQGFWFALSSSPMSSSLWKFSWSSRPQLDLHRSCWLQFLNYITNWGNGYLKTLCDLIACFVDMNYFQSATLYLEDPTAEDCWVKGWGVRVFIKLWHLHHLAFPNDDCEQAIALTSELMSEALVKVIWALKSLGVSKLLHGAPFLFFY